MSGAAEHHVLRLYVSGSTPRSLRAIRNIRNFCKAYLAEHYALEVIDIYQTPLAAQAGQVVAVPMLVRLEPLPSRRVIGDLSDVPRLLAALNLEHLAEGPEAIAVAGAGVEGGR
jgi:circadian clock protein KaiB